MLQRTVFINKIRMPQLKFLSINQDAKTKVFINKIRMLQRTVFINKIRMLQLKFLSINQDATTKVFINKIRMQQRTVFINKIRMLQRTVFINKIRMLQRTQRNTIGRRSKRLRMTCRAFPLWLERQSSTLLSFVRFSYQFGAVICWFASLAVKIFLLLFCYIILAMSQQNRVRKLSNLDIKEIISELESGKSVGYYF
jgi:hypothetical protein